MTNIFETLREDHEKQRTLLELVAKTHGDSSGRRELFQRLESELRNHAAAEERVFYSTLMADQSARDQASHSVKEHQDAECVLDELSQMEFSNPNWIRKFEQLRSDVEHHLEEEEHGVFQLAGKVLSEQQKQQMAAEFTDAKQTERQAS